MTVTLDFIRALPKAELHVHIEGTLEPELMFALAQKNAVPLPYADVAAVRAAYQFADLQAFLDLYYAGAAVLIDEEDFYALTMAYLTRAHEDGVIHAELFFDPQTHTERGIAMGTVINGLQRGCDEARQKWGMSTRLILCFLRHLSEEAGLATLVEAMPHVSRIHGFGLDSAERGHPPSKFTRLFQRCHELALPVVAHAGEEGPPEYITEALDLLQVARIDHGVRIMESPALIARVAAAGIPLTVCPLSNLKLNVVDDLAKHPLKRMLEAGLTVTINSDDPAYFGGYIAENYWASAQALNLSRAQLAQIARNSLTSSFVPQEMKALWCAKLSEVPLNAPT